MKVLEKLFEKYKSLIYYGVFGVLTTLVNMAAYAFFYYCTPVGNTISVILAWVLAVTFAYVTNKIWVFDSKIWKWDVLRREIVAFVSCRLSTLGVELVLMYIGVDILKWNEMLMKLMTNVLVIILNYIFSKLVIFKKK